jgi:hypothetical protein
MKTFCAAIAAAALLSASTAAGATRSAESLPPAGVKLSPNLDGQAGTARKGSRLGESEAFVGIPIFVLIGGLAALVGFLELTGVIDIFDDTPDSP